MLDTKLKFIIFIQLLNFAVEYSLFFSQFLNFQLNLVHRAAGLETKDEIAVVAKCSALNMSTKLRAGSSEAPINFFTLLLKIYFMGYIHQQWVIRSKLVGVGNQCSQNAKLNYFGSQVYFHFFPKSSMKCKMHRNS